jgi:hypothetical protein
VQDPDTEVMEGGCRHLRKLGIAVHAAPCLVSGTLHKIYIRKKDRWGDRGGGDGGGTYPDKAIGS